MSTAKTISVPDCVKNLNRSEDEIIADLKAAGIRKIPTKMTKISTEEEIVLKNHIEKQQKKTPKSAVVSQKKIGNTQVVETQTKRKPARRDLSEIKALMAKSSAKTEEVDSKPAPAAKTQTAKTAAVKKTKAADKPAPTETKTVKSSAAFDSEKLLKMQAEQQQRLKATSAQKAKETKEAKEAKVVADKTAKPAPAAKPEKSVKPEQPSKDAKDEKEATAEPSPKTTKKQKKSAEEESSSSPKRKKDKRSGTIKLGVEAIKAHRKKRKQHISRTAAREQIAENIHAFQKPTAPVIREIKIPDAIEVSRLANDMSLKSSVIIRKLMDYGMSVTANELLDKDTAWVVVEELGHKPINAPDDDLEDGLLARDDAVAEQQPRAPVVTVMGHVDHGKTSLLDYIRKTRVAVGEAGGITQHIGAYRVESSIGAVTFLDTPGHALFTQMRARGAQITDIVVLVVAADDGVKPQTIEAIDHVKAAGVPIVVAANKVDKPEADLEKVKRELANHNVLPEDWGGDAPIMSVSAATGEGVDKLLEALATQAEILELKAPVDVPATAVVIETRIDKGRGVVATLVVTSGTLRRGDTFICGTETGRVRAMWDASHPSMETAAPSMPVELQGLSGVPEAGSELWVMEDERKARDIADMRKNKSRMKRHARNLSSLTDVDPMTLLDANPVAEEWKDLNVVLKADVEGAREALVSVLSGVAGKRAGVKVVHSAVGAVTESDIYLAQTGDGVVVAFNVRPNGKARKLAESRNVKVIFGNVIYELVEKVRDSVLDLLAPVVEERVIGMIDVLNVFGISGVGSIAGCRVNEGMVRMRSDVRLVRDGVRVYEGTVSSLRRFKEEVAEVRNGLECGIGIGKFNDIKVGDTIEVLERIEHKPEM